MDIKDKKLIALHALETARLALYPPFVCANMKCTDCPFYTDKRECIYKVISDLLYKAREKSNYGK